MLMQMTEGQARDAIVQRADSDADENEALKELIEVLDRIPFVKGFKRDLSTLTRTIYERRPPRILALGSEGSGRSQLLDALLGAPVMNGADPATRDRWIRVDALGRRVHWLELRVAPDAPEHFRTAADERVPDIVLLVATPQEVEAGLGQLLECWQRCLRRLQTEEAKPTVIPVMTKIDSLPPETAAYPFPEEKQHRVALVRQRFAKQLEEAAMPAPMVHAVATPEPGERRIGIEPVGTEPLAEAIAAAVPERAQLETVRAMRDATKARRKAANGVTRAASTLSVTVALMPVPLADIAIISPLQAVMVSSVAYMSGRPWDTRTAGEWIASVGLVGGAGVGLRMAARQILKMVPTGGMFVSGGIAGAGTWALGRAAIRYFLDDPVADDES